MRVLVGHTVCYPETLQNQPLPGREGANDEIISFGFAYPQFPYHKGMTFEEILANCPEGWKPEVYIHWSPEYNPVPLGIEKADCLTVGVFGDWNLGGQAIHAIGGAFDVMVADRGGYELLRNAGFTEVLHGLLWAQDPALHRVLPDAERDIDVLMIGNFNHAVQQERSLWLARVSRLAEKHNVVLTSGLYGEDYVRMMNRAKIVFNRSIRGELNMRAYEAPACGALLFYERGNAEVDFVFRDREECVLYGDDDLEALLDHYLAPENQAERERIAQNGTARVQTHTYSHHFGEILNQIEAYGKSRTPKPRAYTAHHHAIQWLTCYEPNLAHNLNLLLQMAQAEAKTPTEQSDVANLEGTWRAIAGQLMGAPTEKSRLWNEAIPYFQRATTLNPQNTLAYANLGTLLLMGGNTEAGTALVKESIRQLQAIPLPNTVLEGVLFPRLYDYYLVRMERVMGKYPTDSPEGGRAVTSLLLSRLSLSLSEVAYRQNDFGTAIYEAEVAVEYATDNPMAHYHLARALRAYGYPEEAITHYRKQVSLAPFELQGWEELAQLYCDLSRPQEAVELLNDLLSILRGSPYYADQYLKTERLRQQAALQARQTNGLANLQCFLAFPNWSSPDEWQEIVRLFAQRYRPTDPTLLMLRADPSLYPNTQTLLTALQSYLLEGLRLPNHALPRITLLNQPMNSDDLWKAVSIAQACVVTSTLPPLCKQLAENLGKPLITVAVWEAVCV